MKIVHIEDFFHPDAGYQVNVLAKYLKKFGHEVIVITAEMDKIPEYLTRFFGRDNIACAVKIIGHYAIHTLEAILKGLFDAAFTHLIIEGIAL